MTRIPRLETGTVQDRDDWPGVFIRGDHALAYAVHLEEVLDKHEDNWVTVAVLRALVTTLRGCQAGGAESAPQRILHLAAPEEP